MNDDQRDNFMEKKIKRTEKTTNSGSGINEKKVIVATILVAIVIMSGVLVAEMLKSTSPEQFSALYVLDSDKQANNYPRTVILGTNSTFSLWVGVENQRDNTREYSVQVKLDDGKTSEEPSLVEPVQVFNRTLADGETWEFQVTIDIDQPGNNRIIFELQFYNVSTNKWEYAWIRLDFTVEAIQA